MMQLRKNWKSSGRAIWVSNQPKDSTKKELKELEIAGTVAAATPYPRMQLRKNWKVWDLCDWRQRRSRVDVTKKELKEDRSHEAVGAVLVNADATQKELKEQENYVIHLLCHSEDVT